MTNSQRQHGIAPLKPGEKIVGKPGGLVEPGVKQYGFLKKAFKKIKKGAKKVWKSPLGKAAIIGGLGAIPFGASGTSLWGRGIGALRGMGAKGAGKYLLGGPRVAGGAGAGNIFQRGYQGLKNFGLGKAAFLGTGALATALPFMGGDEEDEVIDDWSVTPSSIKNIHKMAKDRHADLKFLPSSIYAAPGYYNMAQGGVASLANGGEAGQAQAEQMLRMEYQKYRNQGGTMSYQQFKMAVLQQAQGQGPVAQAANGGRRGYQGGEIVEDASLVEDTPSGLMAENIEEVQGEPSREQLEALAMEIFQLRLEELDEEQLMVVYQAAMQQQPEAASEDVQFAAAPQEEIMQAACGGRIKKQEGGIMDLGGMEKDYRQEGGFVPLGGEEKADDVPARLSKNEFVFTADAVRAAGGGDIDAGAEVMENIMENLEEGGEISEESQGQGAQGMYDNMQQLQSRIA
jgi:hypothetical protein